jgi:3-oxoacyl-[acyl-carrier protein] reductase
MAQGSYDPTRSRPRFGFPAESGAGSVVEQLLEEVETQAEADASLEIEGLEGKVAIVTGGSTGIGRAVALALAQAGAHVAFSYANDELESSEIAIETAGEVEAHGVRVFHRPVACTESRDVRDFVDETLDHLGGVHILVNGAGVTRQGLMGEMSDEEWGLTLRMNLSGTSYFLRAVAPLLQEQEYGKIVNMTLVKGTGGEIGFANVSASRAGILALTRSAAMELGPSNVNVNAVAPGAIRRPDANGEMAPEALEGVSYLIALGRLGDPQDVARVVLFLCSEAARHVTGAVLPVDGGSPV